MFFLYCVQGHLSRQFVKVAFSPNSSNEVKEESLLYSSMNDMFVCKAFNQQFQWATPDEWSSLNSYSILIMQGEDDQITPLSGAEKLVNEVFVITKNDGAKSSKDDSDIDSSKRILKFHVIKNAGHMVMMEQPDQVFNLCKSFLYETLKIVDTAQVNIE